MPLLWHHYAPGGVDEAAPLVGHMTGTARAAMPGVWFAPHEQNARHVKAAAGGLSRD
jgi:hypothetical protein